MVSNQETLERFSSKGKQLLSELNRIPDCDAQIVKKEMDSTVDQWLDVSSSEGRLFNLHTKLKSCQAEILSDFLQKVSEKIEENLESLRRSSALWLDIYDINAEIESWSNISMMDLTDGVNNFNDSQKTENRLCEVKARLKLSYIVKKCKCEM